jgi:glycosyltransferase involved in cell wall biosynthesis
VDKLTPVMGENDICIAHNIHTLHKNLPLTAALHQLLNPNLITQIAWCHDFAWNDSLYKPQLHPGFPWELMRSEWPKVVYVTVSEHRRQILSILLKKAPDEIFVITPGIPFADFFKFEPLTRSIIDRLDLLQADPIFLLPARVTRRKNIEFAIQVIAAIRPEYPDVCLVITGPPGPHNPTNVAYLESLKELRQELGVTSNVHFLYEFGTSEMPMEIPDKVVADLYQLADALLFPSRHEGFGIPVLEAGLSRMPVFAADIPPVRESSKGYANFINLSDEPEIVGKDIVSYLKNNQAYQLKRSVLKDFTWESIVQNKIISMIEP